MPSDQKSEYALGVLKAAANAYRSSLAATLAQARAQIAVNGGDESVSEEDLGKWGLRYIDPDRFALLERPRPRISTEIMAAIKEAEGVIAELSDRLEELFLCEVPTGGSLRDTAEAALAQAGRAFGAARIIDLALSGKYDAGTHAHYLRTFPFRHWNARERAAAPPLVITLEGSALQADELIGFVDGAQKIVLLVKGAAPPAALVRLVAPRTLVTQTLDGGSLSQLGAYVGTGVGAWMEDGAAEFVHAPFTGQNLWDRLVVTVLPEQAPKFSLGGRSPAQQLEDLQQLATMATPPAGLGEERNAPTPTENGAGDGPAELAPPGSPIEKLGAWILSQTDLSGRP